jgi:hypothetical protein
LIKSDLNNRYTIVTFAIELIYSSHYKDQSKSGLTQRSATNNFEDINDIVNEFDEKLKTEENEQIKSVGPAIVGLYKNGLKEDIENLWDWYMPMLAQMVGPEITNMMDSVRYG